VGFIGKLPMNFEESGVLSGRFGNSSSLILDLAIVPGDSPCLLAVLKIHSRELLVSGSSSVISFGFEGEVSTLVVSSFDIAAVLTLTDNGSDCV